MGTVSTKRDEEFAVYGPFERSAGDVKIAGYLIIHNDDHILLLPKGYYECLSSQMQKEKLSRLKSSPTAEGSLVRCRGHRVEICQGNSLLAFNGISEPFGTLSVEQTFTLKTASKRDH